MVMALPAIAALAATSSAATAAGAAGATILGMSASTAAMALAGVSALATVGSTVAGVQSAKANAAASKMEAKQLEQSQQMDMAAERLRNKEALSKGTAIAAASGVGTTSGTPLENALNSAFEGEMNALRIGYGYEQRRQTKKFEAGMYRAQIPGIISSGIARTSGSLLRSYAMPSGTRDYGLGSNYDTSV